MTGSDTEVGAALFVRPPSLLRGVSAASAALGLQARLFPLSVAGSVLSVPFLQGPLPPALRGPRTPAVGGFGPPLGRARPPALRRPSLLQEPLQGPPPAAGRAFPPAAGRALAPPPGRGLASALGLLPPLQRVVGASGALPAPLGGPPAWAIGRQPLGGRLPSPLGRPVLGAAGPAAAGGPGSPVPRVVLTGRPAGLPAAPRGSPVRPLVPVRR